METRAPRPNKTSCSAPTNSVSYGKQTPFKAGRLPLFVHKWQELTSDPEILNMVNGLHLEFADEIPAQGQVPRPIIFTQNEVRQVDEKISKLLQEGVIEPTIHEKGQFINSIFTRPKPDGSCRMILNMKPLNQFIEYKKFKMDTLRNALQLVKRNCFMATVDIKDAYFTIRVAEEHHKYLKFLWKEKLYQFVVMPMGYTQAPRKFTKLLKPVFSFLRKQGYLVLGYIDDILILGQTATECEQAVEATVSILQECGFIINWAKSAISPVTEIKFLGFLINSETMQVRPTAEKICKYKTKCLETLRQNRVSIRELAHVIGNVISCFDGVQYGPLHYRTLERAKVEALRENDKNYDAKVALSPPMKTEINWWVENLDSAYNMICRNNPDVIISTDSTRLAWGCACGVETTNGSFSEAIKLRCGNNINALEMLAIKFGLQSFEDKIHGKIVQIKSDNTTAVAYVNHMGGMRSPLCNAIAQEIWAWCIPRNIWVTSEHIPGVLNFVADFESRHPNDRTEWALNSNVFQRICNKFGTPSIDLFASHDNHKLPIYCSWRRQPGAAHINAFSISWTNEFVYCFPPFSLIAPCLNKMHREKATGIMIVPNWTTQIWFPLLSRMLVATPLLLPRHASTLQLPSDMSRIHPLHPKLQLLACKVSGDDLKIQEFQPEQVKLLCPPGEKVLRSNMTSILKNGDIFVCKGVLIKCNPL